MPIHLVTFPTAPHTEVTAQGDIVYSEVVREGVRKLEAYVEEMDLHLRPLRSTKSRRMCLSCGTSSSHSLRSAKSRRIVSKLFMTVWSDLSARARRRKLVALLLALAVHPPNSCARRSF